MSDNNTPRKRLIRAIKEKFIPKLEQENEELMAYIPDYAEGTDSNMGISVELQGQIEINLLKIEAYRRLLNKL